MDFLDPAKKRAHTIRLYIGYALIGLIIFTIATILLMQSYGYDLDRKTGNIIQNGLVFVTSQPEAADVYLNGKLHKSQSNARLVLPADNYTLELKRAGYQTWTRRFTLMGGTIERFVYPFLFPEKLDTADRKLYASMPGFATQSPDRHWILVQQPDQFTVFDQFDANDPKKPETTLTLPAALFTQSTEHSLKLVEWSTDNRHVLVEHTFKGGHEFVVIDREDPAASVNVNKAFNRDPFQVTMRDKHFDKLYLYDQTNRTLDFGDLKDGTVKPVLERVLKYKTHGDDMIIYATDKDTQAGKAKVVIKDGDGSYALREVPADQIYLLDMARFDGRWYVAAGSGADGRVFVYKDPLTILKAHSTLPLIPSTVLRLENPSVVAFSANARFIMAQGSAKIGVYDAETDRSYRYALPATPDPTEYVRWMDGHRLTIINQGKFVVFDYDGINQRTLTANTPGFTPFFDRDYEVLYNVGPSVSVQGRAALTRTNLKIVPAGQ